jgi:putative lysine/arginine/ornithine/histidine/octopine transport system permease protein
LMMTIQLSVICALLGGVLGLVLAGLLQAPLLVVRLPVRAFITFMRGVPELLIILALYYGLSAWLHTSGFAYSPSKELAGITALSLVFSCYAAEVFRGAWRQIPIGEREAATALGFSRLTLLRRVVWPQTFSRALPGLGNLFQVLLKDSSLLSVIGLMELMSETKRAISITSQPFTFFALASLLYLLLTYASGGLQKWLEKDLLRGTI